MREMKWLDDRESDEEGKIKKCTHTHTHTQWHTHRVLRRRVSEAPPSAVCQRAPVNCD